MRLDVADEAQVKQVVDQVVAELGRIDILVNNAGINTLKHRVTLDAFPKAEWDRIIAVDLTGLYLVSQAVTRQMLAQRPAGGRVINIASVAGFGAAPPAVRLYRRQSRGGQPHQDHGH